MSRHYDVIIVGAGHNGLVCANVLSQRGHKVLVLEANSNVGGLVSTREFAPGFKVSSCSHLFYGLHPEVHKLCQLDEAGLKLASSGISTLLINQQKEFVRFSSTNDAEVLYSSSLSEQETGRWRGFLDQMNRFSDLLFRLADKIPPRLKNATVQDYRTLLNLGLSFRRLQKQEQRQLLRIIGMNVYDLVNENLTSDLLKAGVCFESILGSRLGPRAPNSVFNWLNRRSMMNRQYSGLSFPAGGLGSITQLLCEKAMDRGVDVSVSSRVSQILVADNSVTGVALSNGEQFSADKVVSNVDIKQTLLSLVGAKYLDTDVVRRISHLPVQGSTAKLHIALDRLPDSLSGQVDDFSARIIHAADPDMVERASNAIKYNEYATHPVFEITVPSVLDQSMTAHSRHVMSVLIPYVPYQHKRGWDREKSRFEDHMLEHIESLFPGTRAALIHVETLTPVDIEQLYNVTGGHWHHVEPGLERMLMLRPVPGFGQYQTAIRGLFLCGADCHPGGDVSGAPGLNAAAAVMRSKTT